MSVPTGFRSDFADLLRAMGNDVRLVILGRLVGYPDGEPTIAAVKDLQLFLKGALAGTVSQHLRELKRVNLVDKAPGKGGEYSCPSPEAVRDALHKLDALGRTLNGSKWKDVGRLRLDLMNRLAKRKDPSVEQRLTTKATRNAKAKPKQS